MNTNVLTLLNPRPPTDGLAPHGSEPARAIIGGCRNVTGLTSSDPVLEMADHEHIRRTRRNRVAALLMEELGRLTDCPASDVDHKLEEGLPRICRLLGERTEPQADDGLANQLKWVIQAVAGAIARKTEDDQKLAQEALARSQAEIERLKDRLQAEAEYLRAEIETTHLQGEIVGRSPGLKRVLHQAEQVAPADCAVLITGETGTGKELIAEQIHRLSARKGRAMVLVNCAALPTALVESELFGRERGAYTGALTSQVGRFEVADGSTIFLDEIGELPMEVQAKLLRILQEGEFQRLGSPKTHKVNVRLITATNRDLAEQVRKGSFREDLYYRLRVFPIEIPPLRERVEDIPALTFSFMQEFSTRMGKKITKVSRRAMEALQKHNWPGNIRELRNVIEHSVIVTAGDTLKLAFMGDSPVRDLQPRTLAEAERQHILKSLESTGWRIKGPHGAARKLDLQPSTLYSRMQKLGIPHRRQKEEMGTIA